MRMPRNSLRGGVVGAYRLIKKYRSVQLTADKRLRCFAPSPKFAYRRTSFIRTTLYAKTLEINIKDARKVSPTARDAPESIARWRRSGIKAMIILGCFFIGGAYLIRKKKK